jgi:hypothetical protein
VPLPEAPEVMVIQDSLLVAVQAQVTPAVTATEPGPPAAGGDALVGSIA